jgi:predicted lipid-binding transport protein (Tim44 family)
LGFGGYLRVAQNPDSFATLFALVFFSFFAWVGFFAGMASGALIGGLSETLLRRAGAGIGGAVCAATLVTAFALWQIAGFVQQRYPGLRSENAAKPHRGSTSGARPPAAEHPASSALPPPTQNTCAHLPPADSKERAMWNAECQ